MATTNKILSAVSFLVTVWAVCKVGRGLALMFALTAHVSVPSAGWYAVALLGILIAHELGHMVAAWWIGLEPGWPVFFPYPLAFAAWLGWAWLPAFGTLGAWVPIWGLRRRSGADQWSVAVAGLLTGFVAAGVCVVLGIGLSVPAPAGPHVWATLPIPWLLRAVVPDGLVWHPTLIAGWLGLLVTGLNLLPLPGLDGWKLWAHWDDYSTAQKWGSVILGGGGLLACSPAF